MYVFAVIGFFSLMLQINSMLFGFLVWFLSQYLEISFFCVCVFVCHNYFDIFIFCHLCRHSTYDCYFYGVSPFNYYMIIKKWPCVKFCHWRENISHWALNCWRSDCWLTHIWSSIIRSLIFFTPMINIISLKIVSVYSEIKYTAIIIYLFFTQLPPSRMFFSLLLLRKLCFVTKNE